MEINKMRKRPLMAVDNNDFSQCFQPPYIVDSHWKK